MITVLNKQYNFLELLEPQVGKIRINPTLSDPYRKEIYVPCERCEQKRWVRCVRGEAAYKYCRSCAATVGKESRIGRCNAEPHGIKRAVMVRRTLGENLITGEYCDFVEETRYMGYSRTCGKNCFECTEKDCKLR